jgi:uncharacterized protein YbjQ (UPF0145 family)
MKNVLISLVKTSERIRGADICQSTINHNYYYFLKNTVEGFCNKSTNSMRDFPGPEISIKNLQDSNDQVQANSVIRHDVRSKTLKRIFLMTACRMNLQQRIIRHSTFCIWTHVFSRPFYPLQIIYDNGSYSKIGVRHKIGWEMECSKVNRWQQIGFSTVVLSFM